MPIVPADAVTVLGNREASQKVASTGPKAWLTLQPNPGGIQGFRATQESVARKILSKNLTPEAGDNVGMSVSPTLVHDVTKDALDFYAADMWRCLPTVAGTTGQALFRPTAVTGTGYTVGVNGAIPAGFLVFGRGFSTPANNGLKLVPAGSVAATINAPGNVAEAAPPANATLEIAGFQATAAADIQLNASGDLICTTANFTTWGLSGGQIIKLGGTAANTFFATAAYNGWAEVDPTRAITATLLPLRNHSWTVGAADLAAGKTIQVFFTEFLRNYPLGNVKFSRATSQLEMEQFGAGAGGVSSFRYLKGLRVGNVEIDAPLKSKITMTLSFVGMDVPDPVLQVGRLADTATPLTPLAVAMFDTTNDLKHLRIATASNNTPLMASVETWTFTQGLNIKAKEIQGVYGADDHIDGELMPSLSISAYLDSDDIPKAARDNRNVRFCAVLANEDGGWALNVPSAKVRSDEEVMQAGEGVMVSVTLPAHREGSSGIASSLSRFAHIPQ